MNSSLHNRHRVLTNTLGALIFSTSLIAFAQDGNSDGEWPSYAADAGSTKYTSLSQIDGSNFAGLEIAWRWQSIDGELDFEALLGLDAEVGFGRLQATPLMIDGVLYLLTALNQVVALDAVSGEELWRYDPEVYMSGVSNSPLGFHHRGVAWWSDGVESRVLMTTNDGFIISLNAQTGELDADFAGGRIDMTNDIPRAERDVLDYTGAQPLGGVSPPTVVGDVLVVQHITSNRPRFKERPPTWVRGYNIRTGELIWTFHTIPQGGEFGVETWQEESWRYTGNGGVWTQMSADLELGYVYLPTEASTNDFYGGHRPGDNLFTQSLVALDASTGDRVWHFQMVHHGLWDYDTPAAPNLIDINVDGREIKAIAQVTKQGFVYAFDRLTGEPLWEMEDRAVPASNIPGEKLATTQPFPTKPPPFEMQGISEDDLIDFTPELRQEALEVMANYDMGPLFNPPIHDTDPAGKISSAMCPGDGGGANITAPPVADPTSGFLYVSSARACSWQRVIPGEEADARIAEPTGSTFALYANDRSGRPPRLKSGIPYFKPPYSTITAYDMNTGEIAFQIPTGETPDRIRNSPALEGIDIGDTGTGNQVPMVTTKNLLIYSDLDHDGSTALLYAIDKKTGNELDRVEVPARSRYGMSSWMHDGHQYIILQTGAKLTAMALPGAKADGGGGGH